MRTITTRTEWVPSVDINGETITLELLKKILADITECSVEYIRVVFKSHSVILNKFTDVQQMFEHFKDLEENYCEHCGCSIAECNGGFTDEDGEHYQFAV